MVKNYYAIVIRSFGTGNGPNVKEILEDLLYHYHIPTFNVTECIRGSTGENYIASIEVSIIRDFL
jgi:L-asparaginase/Glu-tRNA(Gln) amidotransferase subunit D